MYCDRVTARQSALLRSAASSSHVPNRTGNEKKKKKKETHTHKVFALHGREERRKGKEREETKEEATEKRSRSERTSFLTLLFVLG